MEIGTNKNMNETEPGNSTKRNKGKIYTKTQPVAKLLLFGWSLSVAGFMHNHIRSFWHAKMV
jgi:hypothetical protein